MRDIEISASGCLQGACVYTNYSRVTVKYNTFLLMNGVMTEVTLARQSTKTQKSRFFTKDIFPLKSKSKSKIFSLF